MRARRPAGAFGRAGGRAVAAAMADAAKALRIAAGSLKRTTKELAAYHKEKVSARLREMGSRVERASATNAAAGRRWSVCAREREEVRGALLRRPRAL